MQIKVETTIDDLIEFSIYCYGASPAMRRQKVVSILVSPIFFVFLGLMILGIRQQMMIAAVFIAAAPILGLLGYLNFDKNMRKRLRKIYAEKPMPLTIGEMVLEMNEESISELSGVSERRDGWSAVGEIYTDDRYAFVMIGNLMGYMIPRDHVLEGDFDEFVECAKKYWEKANSG